MSPRTGWILFALSLLAAAAHLAWAQGVLPDRVASHFGAGGAADGWSSRAGFLVGYAVAVVLASLACAGSALLLPRLPRGVISVPHRDHWLAPARADATLRRVAAWLLAMAAATNLFLVGCFHLSVRASLGPGEPRLGPAFGILLVGYLVFTGVWSLVLVLGFRRRGDA